VKKDTAFWNKKKSTSTVGKGAGAFFSGEQNRCCGRGGDSHAKEEMLERKGYGVEGK